MGAVSLDAVHVTPLKRMSTPGGDVLHAMKRTDAGYAGFGEIYFSWVECDAVKAWKRHIRMTMNLVVPVGSIRFVFYVEGETRFRTEEIGVERYVRLTVPPGVLFGFKGLARPQSLLMNLASIPHDPEEVERFSPDEFKYAW